MREQEREKLTVRQTASNYWVVESGTLELAGSLTRKGAEAERELMRRLRRRAAEARSSSRRRPRAAERSAR
jgi:hypothetical protein